LSQKLGEPELKTRRKVVPNFNSKFGKIEATEAERVFLDVNIPLH